MENTNIEITNNNGILTVSSLQIAKDFNKQHNHIVRDIENLIKQVGGVSKIGQTYEKAENPADFFIETAYQNPQNKQKKGF